MIVSYKGLPLIVCDTCDYLWVDGTYSRSAEDIAQLCLRIIGQRTGRPVASGCLDVSGGPVGVPGILSMQLSVDPQIFGAEYDRYTLLSPEYPNATGLSKISEGSIAPGTNTLVGSVPGKISLLRLKNNTQNDIDVEVDYYWGSTTTSIWVTVPAGKTLALIGYGGCSVYVKNNSASDAIDYDLWGTSEDYNPPEYGAVARCEELDANGALVDAGSVAVTVYPVKLGLPPSSAVIVGVVAVL